MKKNKPRWRDLPSSERLARKAKSYGFPDNVVNNIREYGKKAESQDAQYYRKISEADAEMHLLFV